MGSLILVLEHFVYHILELDSSGQKHRLALGTVVVLALADDAFNAAVDDHHRAGSARCHSAIHGRTFNCHAPLRCLANRVLLGVNRPYAVLCDATILVHHFFELMTDFVAVWQAAWGAHIACGQDLVILAITQPDLPCRTSLSWQLPDTPP